MALTRDNVFWSAFTDHAQHTVRAATLLVEMLEHLDRREPLAAEIKELEQRAIRSPTTRCTRCTKPGSRRSTARRFTT
jgi:hypothetical protein